MANLPKWAPVFNNTLEVKKLLNEMRATDLIREKEYDNVSSFSFHRKVFYDKKWDKSNVKARGLFINTKTKEIVARSYNKFFNIEERSETQMRNLKKNFCWPVESYIKENGFLGIAGYDKLTGKLFTASKSTPEGPFADLFRKVLFNEMDPDAIEMMKEYMRDGFCSFIFEVNDPVNDSHMIEYDKAHVVLLDVVKRSPIFEKMSYEELCEVANMFDFKVKEQGPTFPDWDIFSTWYSNTTRTFNYIHNGTNIEGLVLEDSLGFQTKVKLRYYSFWKYMRSVKNKILRHRIKGKKFPQQLLKMNNKLEQEFVDWAKIQSDDVLEKDIIQLRHLFCENPTENDQI